MNALIISDCPNGSTFDQITNLRDSIKRLDAKVDLLVFAEDGVYFNDRIVSENHSEILFLEPILRKKRYDLVAISLGLEYLRRLFLKNPNLVDFLEEHSPQTKAYIFGASTLLAQIDKDSHIQIYLYPRPGVSKLTKEFKKAILSSLKKS